MATIIKLTEQITKDTRIPVWVNADLIYRFRRSVRPTANHDQLTEIRLKNWETIEVVETPERIVELIKEEQWPTKAKER